jgi:hypothetical protein
VEHYSSAYRPLTERERARRSAEASAPSGAGWVVFAGVLLALIGAMNVIYGVAAISNSRFYVRHAHYVMGGLSSWGWFLLVVGVIQLCAALAIWREAGWGRVVGTATAIVNALLQLLWMPARPLAALALLTADVVLLYALLRIDSMAPGRAGLQ